MYVYVDDFAVKSTLDMQLTLIKYETLLILENAFGIKLSMWINSSVLFLHSVALLMFLLLSFLPLPFFLKISSAFYVCCIYSNALHTTCGHGTST